MNKYFACLMALFFCASCFGVPTVAEEEKPIAYASADGVKVKFDGPGFFEESSVLDSIDSSDVIEVPDRPDILNEKITPDPSFEEYRLGVGDKIKIHVFRQPDMDVEVRLGASGDIRYPFLGKIHVVGMSLPSLERKITDDLSDGYLVNPQVRISIEEFRPFYVNGEVKAPGAYPYQPGLTVRKAISLAGGFTIDADIHKIFLIHAVDIYNEESHALLSQRVSPGDILTIKKSFFFVNGEVNNPGKYSYQAEMTYRMAIAIAGGLKEKSDDNKVYVIHEGQGRKTFHVDNLDDRIKPGDVITAKEGFF